MKVKYSFRSLTRMISVVCLIVIVSSFSCSDPEVTVKDLKTHIMFLSSDTLKGRMTGDAGDSLAALYIQKRFASYGMQPVSGDGFQRFRVSRKVNAGSSSSLAVLSVQYTLNKDFVPPAFSSNATAEAEVVFAGYGFNIDNDSLKWNDFKDLDIKGKWVMVLRADPEADSLRSPFIPFSGDRDKALLAKDMGAAGLLLVSGQAYDPKDEFEALNYQDHSTDLPVLRIKRAVADEILSGSGQTIAGLEKKLNDSRKPYSFATGKVVSGTSEIVREDEPTRNVVMMLPGNDEQLRNEYVVIGAHFDHIGMGGPGSSSRAVDTIAVHHGADDNASGVALMLELAEKLSYLKGNHKRSFVFVAFSGEEMGLLGSKYFTENPLVDLKKVNAMFNLDMVGRLQETNLLQVSGAGTAEGFRNIITEGIDTSVIKLTLSDEGYGPSDQSSFYGRNIPVLFFTTGPHLDYHTPSDTWDKINYEGIVNISKIVYNLALKLSSSGEKLAFRESGPKVETGRVMRRKGVTLGIMPDFAGNVKNGLRADFVTPGKPAAIGGMKKGDIITAINGKTVNNIQDYMYRMAQLKHGQTINVEVLRDQKKVILLIQL